jgi:hypothetical protein
MLLTYTQIHHCCIAKRKIILVPERLPFFGWIMLTNMELTLIHTHRVFEEQKEQKKTKHVKHKAPHENLNSFAVPALVRHEHRLQNYTETNTKRTSKKKHYSKFETKTSPFDN